MLTLSCLPDFEVPLFDTNPKTNFETNFQTILNTSTPWKDQETRYTQPHCSACSFHGLKTDCRCLEKEYMIWYPYLSALWLLWYLKFKLSCSSQYRSEIFFFSGSPGLTKAVSRYLTHFIFKIIKKKHELKKFFPRRTKSKTLHVTSNFYDFKFPWGIH